MLAEVCGRERLQTLLKIFENRRSSARAWSGPKGLSAGYVVIVGFNNTHFPRDPNATTDEEVCCFLVALSRTRKEYHLISCGRLGNQALRVGEFADWIENEFEEVTVNAAYFN
jgi:hypothetical protein